MTSEQELAAQILALSVKVSKLERASLSTLAAVVQLQAVASRMRFKLNLGLDDELHKEFEQLNHRLDTALERLSESMGV